MGNAARAPGGASSTPGEVVTSYFINTQQHSYPRWLSVNSRYFEDYSSEGYAFFATAKKDFTLQFYCIDGGVNYSAINTDDGSSFRITNLSVFTFEKGKRYRFFYGFTAVGNGYTFATGIIPEKGV